MQIDALLAAILFSILATGVALLVRRKRAAVLAVAALVAMTMIALHAWKSWQTPPAGPTSTVISTTD